MNRVSASIGSAIFFVVAPLLVVGVVPWWMTRWEVQASALAILPLQILGGILIAFGLAVLIDSFARFALQGMGTPAPVLPTRHLVVTGFYRHVRNPMYVALVSLILGQAIVFASATLLVYGALVWICCHAFVLAYEEPTLRRTFGAEYEAYCANVPRWLPRVRPWIA
jgi:protein-S-isoprenylcysteine O-methyltransferase Ste14